MANNDLISRAALKKELAPLNDWSWGNGAYVRDMIDAMPTVDAEPVRRGWWINSLCSKCGTYVYRGDANTYCPGCGAKMYGVIDDEAD